MFSDLGNKKERGKQKEFGFKKSPEYMLLHRCISTSNVAGGSTVHKHSSMSIMNSKGIKQKQKTSAFVGKY